MDIIEVKYDFESDRLQCRACLSVGRKLVPLGNYTHIFMKLSSDVIFPSYMLTDPIDICWECQSLLKKVSQFQAKVKKAQGLLQTGQSFINGPLSALVSITINDTQQTIYLNDNINIHNNADTHKHTENVLLHKDKDYESSTVMHIQNYDVTTVDKGLNGDSADKPDLYEDQALVKSNSDVSEDNPHIDKFISDVYNPNALKTFNNMSTVISIHNGITKENSISSEIPNYRSNISLENVLQVGMDCKTNMVADSKVNLVNDNEKSKESKTNSASSKDDDDFDQDFEIEPLTDFDKKEAHVKPVIKNQKSRWALKRAKQNKKPKFKIVSTGFDETFIRVQISNDELVKCMERDRDSEYYKSKRFKCKICAFGFFEEQEFVKHNKIFHIKSFGNYTCDVCQTKVDKKRHLSVHIAKHYAVYKCTICQFVCRREEAMFWHHQRDHKKVFQCLKCDLKFSNRREFYYHFKKWHEHFVCDYCGITFKMRYCIKDHIRKQHSPFTCALCNKTFARYNGLWLHNKLCHSRQSPAYCVECDTSYTDIYRYKWHLCNSAKHTPKKKVRVPCPGCDKVFTKNIYMKDHYDLVHLKLFKYRCEQCDKNFIRNADLVKHKRRVHDGILPPKNKMCYMCGRGFSTNKILLNHVRTHTGERPARKSRQPDSIQLLTTHTKDAHNQALEDRC